MLARKTPLWVTAGHQVEITSGVIRGYGRSLAPDPATHRVEGESASASASRPAAELRCGLSATGSLGDKAEWLFERTLTRCSGSARVSRVYYKRSLSIRAKFIRTSFVASSLLLACLSHPIQNTAVTMHFFNAVLSVALLLAAPALADSDDNQIALVTNGVSLTTPAPTIEATTPPPAIDGSTTSPPVNGTTEAPSQGRIIGAAANLYHRVRDSFTGLREAYRAKGIMGLTRYVLGLSQTTRMLILRADPRFFSREEAASIWDMLKQTPFSTKSPSA